MELRHFRYFLAVAEACNFTRAAGQLGIAVPTLSRQIKEMEEELGLKLFERSQRQVSLTDAGRTLLVEARGVVERFDAAQDQAQRAARGEIGRLEIGYVASAVYGGLLQRHISGFADANPNVHLSIREYPMADLPRQVAEGKIDLAYVRAPLPMPAEVASLDFDEEGYVLAIHAVHPLAAATTLDPRRLANERFILPEQVSGTLATAKLGGFTPRLGPQPGSLVAVLALVSLAQGVAIVPRSVVGAIQLPHVLYRAVKGLEETSWLGLVHRRFDKGGAVQRFLRYLDDIQC